MTAPNVIWVHQSDDVYLTAFPHPTDGLRYIRADAPELLTQIMPNAGSVFPYAGRSSIYSTLRRACKAAGLEYLGTHQPGRHSYATTLDNAGFSAKAIADAGGWKSVRLVSETYAHPEAPAERAAKLFGKKLTSSKRKA